MLIEKRPEIVQLPDHGPTFEKYPAITVLIGDRIVFCGGIIYLWSRVGQAWLYTVPDMIRYRVSTFPIIKRFVDTTRVALNLERIQTSVQEDFEEGHRLMKHLGFKFEGTHPKYINGLTYVSYAWVRED